MPDEYAPKAYRDPRPLPQQIDAHELRGLNAEETAKLSVIELRRIRELLAQLVYLFTPRAPPEA